ncbi:MAG: class I SAM-dependent methyltransferase [Alphaproteobacteria bacterium]|nr:class I SAM-dependent methyltransferase [Alphaproteobacteria bacterium]
MIFDILTLVLLLLWFAAAIHFIATLIFQVVRKSTSPLSSNKTAITETAKILSQHFSDKPFTLIDIGSGNGRTAIAIARMFPQAKIVGLEHNPHLVAFAKLNAFLHRTKNARFINADAMKTDFKKLKPDAAYLYLGEKQTTPTGKNLLAALPKIIIISNKFEIDGVRPKQTVNFNSFVNGPLRIYKS